MDVMCEGGAGSACGACTTAEADATPGTGLEGNALDDAAAAVGDDAGPDAGIGSLGGAAGGDADKSGCMGMPRSAHDRKLPVTKGTAWENETSGGRKEATENGDNDVSSRLDEQIASSISIGPISRGL